jgi:bifunctional non-homologous end joining protein LigD
MATKKRTMTKSDRPRTGEAPLATYRAKRDFGKTPEPSGQSSQNASPAEKKDGEARGVFCVQKHDATRLHYDVRLEIAGTLMSFAVPKGPSYDPKLKRLAVETEDHPMMYADFEARIPEGQYGAGDMLLWDLGTYETVPPEQAETMRAKGHLHVRFFGEKLRGGWHFVRTKGSAGRDGTDARARARSSGGGEGAKAQWLMFKAEDETADPARDIVTERPESVKSGKSATRGPRRVGASPAGKSAAALAAAAGEIVRATQVNAIDDVKGYLYEIKYDGYRLVAAKAGDDVRLITRGGHDWTDRFAIIAQAVRKLPAREAVIDGEACVVDDAGRPSFQALQAWLAGERAPSESAAALAYVAFDLLWLDGRDLRDATLEERRELLEPLLEGAQAPLSFSRASAAETPAELATILAAARAAGLEGLVAKRRGSKYLGGASGVWRKLKFARRQDCVIVGWVPMAGAPGDLGALILAVMDGGELRHAGRVGTGFDARTRARILAKLTPLAVEKPPIEVPRTPDARWVRPSLVCEVEFGEWTREGSLRRSSFVGLREDKTPEECTVEGLHGEPEQKGPKREAPKREAPKQEAPKREEEPRPKITPPPAPPRRQGGEIAEHSSGPAGSPALPAGRGPGGGVIAGAGGGVIAGAGGGVIAGAGGGVIAGAGGRVIAGAGGGVIAGAGSRVIAGAGGGMAAGAGDGAMAKLPPLSNPTKVLFPRDAITKREILAYYLAVAPVLLPHLAARPLTLQRWPDGIDGEAWYQQNAPTPLPAFVHTAPFEKKKRLIADNVETLAWLANLAALTLHVWSSRLPHLEQPDYTILDLDPGDGTWKDVIDVARAIRTLLDALSLESAVKTSGKRGIHIVVPLAPGPTHDAATAFAQRIAEAVAKVLPDVATTERIKEKRKGRLYIDFLQNGEGKTIVAPYTIRALDGAPVSTPIAWSEVTEKLDPRAFTIRTVPDRIAKHGDLFAVARSGRGRIE